MGVHVRPYGSMKALVTNYPNYGAGTNTRSEVLALWLLLHFAHMLGLNTMKIYGDSKLVINWINGVNRINGVNSL